MAKIKEILEQDLQKFKDYVEENSKHKVKMLNPVINTKVVQSVAIGLYIQALLEGIEKGEVELS